MKKYVNPIPDGGAPMHNNRLNTELNSEIWESIQNLLSPLTTLTEGVVISGCILSPNAANFDMTAGVVFLDGEFMRIAAATNQTFPKYIAAKAVSYETKVFADGATKNLIEVKEAELVGAAPGTQYITIDSLFLTKRWFPVGSENNIIRKKVVPIGFWDMDTNTSVTIVLDTNEINIANVVSLDAVIIRDEVAGAQSISNIVGASGAATNEASAEVSASSSVGSHPYLYSVTVTRLTSGSFDGTAYNDGAINRGFVIIEYIPE